MGDSKGRVFCLVRADLLDYDIGVKAEKQLSKLMRGHNGKYEQRIEYSVCSKGVLMYFETIIGSKTRCIILQRPYI